MKRTRTMSTDEACQRIAALLKAAAHNQTTLITSNGGEIAALIPIEVYYAIGRQHPLMPLAGSGRGLWAKGTRTIKRLRAEWDR